MNQKQLVWDLPVRVFHWTLAVSFAGAWLLAESERWRNLHVAFGYTSLGLIAFRLLWGFVGTRHARFSSFLYRPSQAIGYLKEVAKGRGRHYTGHNPAGSWAVYLLLLLGVATGVSGFLNYNEVGGDAMEEAHEVLASLWLVLVVAHVAGVILSSLAHRENLVRAMITGWKAGAEPGPVAGSRVRALGIALAATVLGFWTWSYLAGSSPVAVAQAADGDHDGEHLFVEEAETDDD